MSKLLLLITSIGAFLSGCATTVSTASGPIDIRIQNGEPSCQGCYNIKYITSKIVDDKLYAVKGSNGLNNGQRISAGVSLGVTNVHGFMATGGNNLSPNNVQYAHTISGAENHFLMGAYDHDADHPYRFFVNIHHNSSFNSQAVHLITDGETTAALPPTEFTGYIFNRSCFASGCVWDEDYVIPYSIIKHDIDSNLPLTLFIGDQVQVQIQSQDGFNKSFQALDQGVKLTVPTDILKAFCLAAESQLSKN